MTTTLRIHDEAQKDSSQHLLMKDIAGIIDVRRSTLANWAIEFSMFIPIVKQGRKEYFRPEAVKVLRYIRDLKEEGYNKLQILESLTKEFPIDIDKVGERVARAYNTKGNSKRKEGKDIVYLAIQSLDEVNERLDRLTQQVGDANPENKRLRELLQSQGQTIDHQGEQIQESGKTYEEQAAKLDKYHKQTDDNLERIVTQSETLTQQHRGGFVNQRQSVEQRDRDLLKQLRKTIEEKEKLIKRRGFFARLLNR